jgi:hypothetical protein
MKVIRLYTGPDGESHFQDIDVPLKACPVGKISEEFRARSMAFLEIEEYYGFHPAPQRQYVLFLDAGVEIEVGDGTRMIVRAGDILLAEDTTGRGHMTRSLGGTPQRSLFVVLD